MGQELECTLRYQRRTLSGKAYLETDHLLFRGGDRLKIPLKDLRSVQAAGGVLKLEFDGGPAELDLGPAAEKWAHKILHPPSRLDKLGVKPGVTVKLIGDFDDDFRGEVRHALGGSSKTDLVIFAAGTVKDLQKLRKLGAGMPSDGALWVVYPKGVTAVREIDVLQAGRAAGFKDIKVAAFSATHTALKFVIPVARR